MFEGILSDREWRDVVAYEGRYRVSEYGDVWSRLSDRLLLPSISVYGYKVITLRKNNHGKQHLIHRLVAETWIGRMPSGMETCHNDDNKNHNHYSNLRYDTSQGNSDDVHRNGKRFGRQKLTLCQVREIRRLYADGELTQRMLADQFETSKTNISKIILRQRWKV